MKRPNPLFKDGVPRLEMLASAVSIGDAPLSPVLNKPMTLVYCGDVPAWADLDNRIVIPVRK